MNQYAKTYSAYGSLMQCLRGTFSELALQTNVTSSGSKSRNIINSIDQTIITAEQERNLPSAELYGITVSIADYAQQYAGQTAMSSDQWHRCFTIIAEAARTLMTITDDMYVTKARKIATQN